MHVVQVNHIKITYIRFYDWGYGVHHQSQNFTIKFSRPESEIAAGSM